MSYKNVRIDASIPVEVGCAPESRVILGASIDDRDESISVNDSLPFGHPVRGEWSWIWEGEWEEIPAGAEVKRSEILHNTYRTVASEVHIIEDTEPEASPVPVLDTTGYIITVRVDTTSELAQVLASLDENGYAYTEHTVVTTV